MSEPEAKRVKTEWDWADAEVGSLPEPQQRTFSGITTPLVLVCSKADMTASEAAAWVTQHQEKLKEALAHHGAILFRGFPLKAAPDFDAFVCGFTDYADLPYESSLSFAVRLQVTGRVCTTNEGKKGGQVFHHEQAQTPLYPSKLFFYCERPATEGGGTAVCPSDEVLRRLRERYPDFVKTCETQGVHYHAYMAAEADASKGVGRSWKSFFGVQDKAAAEARMTDLGYTWEWMEDDVLNARSPPLVPVRTLETGRQVFFNQLVAQVANAREFAQRAEGSADIKNLDKYMRFEDGSSVPLEALEYAKQLCEDTAVELEWQTGDVALIDNFLVMHARRAFEGPRRVLASLVQ